MATRKTLGPRSAPFTVGPGGGTIAAPAPESVPGSGPGDRLGPKPGPEAKAKPGPEAKVGPNPGPHSAPNPNPGPGPGPGPGPNLGPNAILPDPDPNPSPTAEPGDIGVTITNVDTSVAGSATFTLKFAGHDKAAPTVERVHVLVAPSFDPALDANAVLGLAVPQSSTPVYRSPDGVTVPITVPGLATGPEYVGQVVIEWAT